MRKGGAEGKGSHLGGSGWWDRAGLQKLVDAGIKVWVLSFAGKVQGQIHWCSFFSTKMWVTLWQGFQHELVGCGGAV